MNNGRFGICFYQAKTDTNIGTAFRSAYLYGAWGLATIGRRYRTQSSDTVKALKHIQYNHFKSFDQFAHYYRRLAFSIVALELDEKSIKLPDFSHPKDTIYVLGNEVYGIHPVNLRKCDSIIQIPTKEPISMNVSAAASIVMYDRITKSETLL